MQVLLSAIGNFPWSLSVLVMAITAMIIFREPIAVLISRSHELRAGRFFSLKAKPIDPKLIEDALRKAGETAAELWEQLDTRRLVIRDVQGRPRIIASTLPSEESFLALFDQAGQPRATLVASSAIEPDGIACFSSTARPPGRWLPSSARSATEAAPSACAIPPELGRRSPNAAFPHPRDARRDLRLVHRGLRHRRLEGCEGAARRSRCLKRNTGNHALLEVRLRKS